MRNTILAFALIGGLSWGFYALNSRAIQPRTEDQLASRNADTSKDDTSQIAALAKDSRKNGSLIFGGDIMLARSVESYARSGGGWEQVMSPINSVFSSSDCRVANLESPFASNKKQTETGSLVFAAKPEAVAALIDSKITAVSLANNHITDQGAAGLNETQKILKENNIAYGGAGASRETALAPQTIQCGQLKVGLIFASYGTNFGAEGVVVATLEDITPSITEAEKKYDIVAVFAHWGSEYQAVNSPFQKEMAHRYIDAGADLVIGSHPHVIQPIEIYKNKLIAYSLGNFVFDQAPSGEKTEAILLKVRYENNEISATIIPIKIQKYFQPTPVSPAGSGDYLKRLNQANWEFSLPR